MKLYILQAGDRFKVGVTSTTVEKRVKALQTGCPDAINIVCHFECGGDAVEFESFLHGIMGDARSHGEWFRLDSGGATRLIFTAGSLYGAYTYQVTRSGARPQDFFRGVGIDGAWILEFISGEFMQWLESLRHHGEGASNTGRSS